MRTLVVIAALAGCYDPHPADGVPCGPDGACPSGQTCVANVCLLHSETSIDAKTTVFEDGPLPDRDGDGVPDATDNCPDLANPDQANEDGDKFGDVCDPCPVEANDTPSDPDGDGVADGCDPHPTVAGDKIVLFEGFANGIPSSWTVVGTNSTSPGSVSITTVANNHSAIAPPITGLANATLSAGIQVDMEVGAFDSATTIAMPYDPPSDSGIFCELYAPLASSNDNRVVDLYDSLANSGMGVTKGEVAFAWATATVYRVSLNRQGQRYTCNVDDNGTAHATSSQDGSTPASQQASFAVYGANATATWFMIVTSP